MSSSTLYEYKYDEESKEYVAVPVSRIVTKGMTVKADHKAETIDTKSVFPEIPQIPMRN